MSGQEEDYSFAKQFPHVNAMIDAASDERIANNRFRHKYRILTEQEKLYVQRIKDLAQGFDSLLVEIAGTGASGILNSSDLEKARERIIEASMWAVRHVTK